MNYKVEFYKPTVPKVVTAANRALGEAILEQSVERLEESFQDILDSEYLLSVNNSASAIHLALCALDLKRGDKVICAINSYVDIPQAIRHFDSEPIFTDIEPKSYHMQIDSLKKVLQKYKSKKLRAVIVTHFAGLKQDMTQILALAKEYNIAVIEDFTDTPVLKKDDANIQGEIALFSLNYKLDTTIKGAMLYFKDALLYQRAKLLREHGLVQSNKDVSYLYDIQEVGYDYRLDTLSAYLFKDLLQQRVARVKRKKEIAASYFEHLQNVKHVSLPLKTHGHTYSYFIIAIDKNRDAFARELKQKGIEVGLHYIPLNFTHYYKQKYGLKVFNFPNSLSVYQTVMSLPCHGAMEQKDVDFVINAVKEVARRHV